MTQLSTFGGVIVPSPTDAAVVPADLLNVVNQLTGTAGNAARVNAVVSSQAERNVNYDGYPAGGLVICPNLKTIWLSLGKIANVQTWQTIYLDTGWITTGFGYNPNWSAYSAGSVKVRRKGPNFCLRVQATYNGDTAISADAYNGANPGNIADQTVLTSIPSDFIPADEQPAMFFSTYTNGAARLQVDGQVKLLSMNTSSKINPAQPVQMQFLWMADD